MRKFVVLYGAVIGGFDLATTLIGFTEGFIISSVILLVFGMTCIITSVILMGDLQN